MNALRGIAGHFSLRRRAAPPLVALTLALGVSFNAAWATTPLADRPVLSGITPAGNVALALSVEWPTVVAVAHLDTEYDPDKTYVGYFDDNKCYVYNYSATEADRHFAPNGLASARRCTGTHAAKWSGNFLNWATMQGLDTFRLALTGGQRARDTSSETWLEKAFASGQGATLWSPTAASPAASGLPRPRRSAAWPGPYTNLPTHGNKEGPGCRLPPEKKKKIFI